MQWPIPWTERIGMGERAVFTGILKLAQEPLEPHKLITYFVAPCAIILGVFPSKKIPPDLKYWPEGNLSRRRGRTSISADEEIIYCKGVHTQYIDPPNK